MSHPVPLDHCPNCGVPLDRVSHAADAKATPSPGDLTVCLYCAHLLAFDDELQMRELTEAEKVEAAGCPELLRTMEFVRKFNDHHRKNH